MPLFFIAIFTVVYIISTEKLKKSKFYSHKSIEYQDYAEKFSIQIYSFKC